MTAELLSAFLARTVVAGTPLLLGTTGELLAERAGVLNLGVEGMMAVGAVAAVAATHLSGSPWTGALAGAAAAAALALVHAAVSVGCRGNQIVSGLALTTLGVGLSGLAGRPWVGRPLPEKFLPVRIPLLADIPVVGPALFERDALVYLAWGAGLAAWLLLARTRAGLVLRAAGENPRAVEASGRSVALARTLATLAGGAFAGLAGAHLSLATGSAWIEGMVAGRGWIVVALTIFAGWDARRAFAGAFLFGGLDVLQFFAPAGAVPVHVWKTLPYVATLAALTFGRRREAPAALGIPFEPGRR